MEITQTLKLYVDTWAPIVKTRESMERLLIGTKKFKQSEVIGMLRYYDDETELVIFVDDEDIIDDEELLEMSKDELEDYAIDEFGVDIDKRYNIATLIEQVIELKENKED